MYNCGNSSGFGGAQFAVIQVPFSLVGAAPGGGGTTGGVATAPGVAYVPPAGSVLTGATDAGKALDKIGDLLKLLNNAGFTAGNTGTIPVYDAASGKFVPTAPKDLLDPTAMAALLKNLYSAGATGAILQKQPDGSIAAVTLADAIKAGFPTATLGQVLKYDGTKWVAAPDDIGASLSTALAALTPGVPAKVVTLDASGASVTSTPAQVVAAGAAGAAAATSANPLKTISGLDASGALVKTPTSVMGAKTVASAALNAPIVIPAGTATTIATVTAPTTGFYLVNVEVIDQRTVASALVAPAAGTVGQVVSGVNVRKANGEFIYNSGFTGAYPYLNSMPAGTDIGSYVDIKSAGMVELAAGESLTLSVFASQNLSHNFQAPTAITLRYIGTTAIGG